MKLTVLNCCNLLFFFLFVSSIAAQPVDYTMYRFPEIKYRSLQFNGTLNGSTYSAFDNENNRLTNNFNIQYLVYLNQQLRQRITSHSVSNNGSYERNNIKISSYANLSDHYRRYRSHSLFHEFGYTGTASHIYNKLNATTYYSAYFAPALKTGKGRIDVTSSVAQAEFLLDDLNKNGLLTGTIDQQKIFGLAEFMDRFDYTRILDSRVYRVEYIKKTAQWIQDNIGLSNDSEIELSSIVMDNIMYASTGLRSSGKRWSIGIEPKISHVNYYKLDNSYIQYGGDLLWEYARHRPLNRFLQSSFFLYGGISYYKSKSKNIIYSFFRTGFSPMAGVEYSLTYNPNSRTLINARGQLTSQYRINSDNKFNDDRETFILSPKLLLSCNYFINYHMSLNFNAGLRYHHLLIDKNKPNPMQDYIPDNYDPASGYINARNFIMYNGPTYLTGALPVVGAGKLAGYFQIGLLYNIF